MLLLGPVHLDPSRRLLSIEEVAAVLNISRSSVRRLIVRKELPSRRLGRRLLVPPDAVKRLLDE